MLRAKSRGHLDIDQDQAKLESHLTAFSYTLALTPTIPNAK